MLESLDINGRMYLACDRAAHEVGYRASYIERLARGKWIDASFVHGQCFVDLASLEAFVATSLEDTALRLRDAAERERAEAAWLAYELRTRALPEPQRAWLVVGQVGVVTACGLLLSILTFSAVQADMTWDDITAGITQSASVFRERVALPASTVWTQVTPVANEPVPVPFAPLVDVVEMGNGEYEIRLIE